MMRKDASRDRYLEIKRKQDEEIMALGGVPGRKPEFYKKRWGWGEGNVLHYVEEVKHSFLRYFSWETACDYDGYVVAATEFFDGDMVPPEYYTCETCRRMVILRQLGE